MNNSTQILKAKWQGPYSWPGYESLNKLQPIPPVAGVYLQTFKYKDGYLIYAAGITRRAIPVRFKEHSLNYRRGEYNVLNIEDAENGTRTEIWHGWGYARTHQSEFQQRQDEIIQAVEKQLGSFHIFVIELEDEPRTHERIEASVMNNLYHQLPPISEIPDKGMQLSKRWDSESILILNNICGAKLYGLPEYLGV